MATAKQALTQNSDKFTFIITPKKKPDVVRVSTKVCPFLGRHSRSPAAVQLTFLPAVAVGVLQRDEGL